MRLGMGNQEWERGKRQRIKTCRWSDKAASEKHPCTRKYSRFQLRSNFLCCVHAELRTTAHIHTVEVLVFYTKGLSTICRYGRSYAKCNFVCSTENSNGEILCTCVTRSSFFSILLPCLSIEAQSCPDEN